MTVMAGGTTASVTITVVGKVPRNDECNGHHQQRSFIFPKELL